MAKQQLSTKDIEKIAEEMGKANKDLKKELKETDNIMKKLEKSWDSPAYRESKKAFSNFAKKYSEQYEKLIDQYVKFLKTNVSEGYKKTEKANRNLADQYK